MVWQDSGSLKLTGVRNRCRCTSDQRGGRVRAGVWNVSTKTGSSDAEISGQVLDGRVGLK